MGKVVSPKVTQVSVNPHFRKQSDGTTKLIRRHERQAPVKKDGNSRKKTS